MHIRPLPWLVNSSVRLRLLVPCPFDLTLMAVKYCFPLLLLCLDLLPEPKPLPAVQPSPNREPIALLATLSPTLDRLPDAVKAPANTMPITTKVVLTDDVTEMRPVFTLHARTVAAAAGRIKVV